MSSTASGFRALVTRCAPTQSILFQNVLINSGGSVLQLFQIASRIDSSKKELYMQGLYVDRTATARQTTTNNREVTGWSR